MKVEHRESIAAPLSTVWSVTVDLERWPSWTPTVQHVERVDDGPLGVGSRARLRQPGLPEAEWRVTALEEGVRFAWETRVRGMHLAAAHVLEPTEGGTLNVLSVEATGLVARLLGPLLRPALRRALARENAGLRAACEALAGGAWREG